MPTKTKTTNNNRGRPKKEFKLNPSFSKEGKRSRGRPKKDKKIKETDSINTRISKHNKDIKVISENHKKICLEIEHNSFSSKKIDDDTHTNSDRFALWLLVFSMLLFIFSLYKTFYLNNIEKDIAYFENTIMADQVKNIHFTESLDNINNEEKWENITENTVVEDKNLTINKVSNIIETLYEKLNDKDFDGVLLLWDKYMKESSLFRLYYTENWFWNFLSNLTNEKLYVTNIQEVKWENDKIGVKYYSYTIKYKLKNKNEMFEEDWLAAILEREDEKLIWSLKCINTWCSKLPFFNPEKYDIK